jgi:protein-disulfide isomerase
MRLKTICAVMLLAAAACSGQSKEAEVAAPDAVDRMPRAEVEAIVKDYLLKNPEILVEAFTELDRRQTEASFARLVGHDNDPSIGPKNAPITIVEFFDYNCGYCKAANDWVFKQASSRNGEVRVIFKEFPILREDSSVAARAALAADRQGKYREMHVALMKGRDFTTAGLEKTAKSAGLNIERWKKDMADPKLEEHIARVHREAAESGIEATPGFFINGQTYQGFHEPKLEEMMKTAREKLKS